MKKNNNDKLESLKRIIDWRAEYSSVLSLKVVGKNLLGRCPFHDDHNPSFNINSSGRWICYPCNKKGDIFDFYKAYWNTDFFTVFKTLAQKYHIDDYETTVPSSEKILTENKKEEVKIEEETKKFNVEAFKEYLLKTVQDEDIKDNLDKYFNEDNKFGIKRYTKIDNYKHFTIKDGEKMGRYQEYLDFVKFEGILTGAAYKKYLNNEPTYIEYVIDKVTRFKKQYGNVPTDLLLFQNKNKSIYALQYIEKIKNARRHHYLTKKPWYKQSNYLKVLELIKQDIELLDEANRYFHSTLMNHKDKLKHVWDYLKSRGIDIPEVNKYEIGYDDGSFMYIKRNQIGFNYKNKDNGWTIHNLIYTGLANLRTFYNYEESKNDWCLESNTYKRITFPIYGIFNEENACLENVEKNAQFKVIGFTSRTFDESSYLSNVKWLHSRKTNYFCKSKCLFNLQNVLKIISEPISYLGSRDGRMVGYNMYRDTYQTVRSDYCQQKIKTDRFVICEGPMDVIKIESLHSEKDVSKEKVYLKKYFSAVATLGVNYSLEQINLIKSLYRNVTVCYDNDKAGYDGTRAIVKDFRKQAPDTNVKIFKWANPKILYPNDIDNALTEKTRARAIEGLRYPIDFKYFVRDHLIYYLYIRQMEEGRNPKLSKEGVFEKLIECSKRYNLNKDEQDYVESEICKFFEYGGKKLMPIRDKAYVYGDIKLAEIKLKELINLLEKQLVRRDIVIFAATYKFFDKKCKYKKFIKEVLQTFNQIKTINIFSPEEIELAMMKFEDVGGTLGHIMRYMHTEKWFFKIEFWKLKFTAVYETLHNYSTNIRKKNIWAKRARSIYQRLEKMKRIVEIHAVNTRYLDYFNHVKNTVNNVLHKQSDSLINIINSEHIFSEKKHRFKSFKLNSTENNKKLFKVYKDGKISNKIYTFNQDFKQYLVSIGEKSEFDEDNKKIYKYQFVNGVWRRYYYTDPEYIWKQKPREKVNPIEIKMFSDNLLEQDPIVLMNKGIVEIPGEEE